MTDPSGNNRGVAGVERLLSYVEAGKLLGVTDRQVFTYVRRGELPVIKLGRLRRIDPADLRAFIEGRKSTAMAGSGVQDD